MPFHTQTPNTPLEIWQSIGNGASDKMSGVVDEGWQSRPGCYIRSATESAHRPNLAIREFVHGKRTLTGPHTGVMSVVAPGLPDLRSDSDESTRSLTPGLVCHFMDFIHRPVILSPYLAGGEGLVQNRTTALATTTGLILQGMDAG
jgi:hypothetical protein